MYDIQNESEKYPPGFISYNDISQNNTNFAQIT